MALYESVTKYEREREQEGEREREARGKVRDKNG
jgi:hypothetical protein